MVIHQAGLWFLIAGFFFFRYIRANKTIAYLMPNFFFLGISAYKAKNIILICLIAALIVLEIYVAYLKEKKSPFITKIQQGYKPGETLYHYIIFGIIVFAISVLVRFLRG